MKNVRNYRVVNDEEKICILLLVEFIEKRNALFL